MALSVRAYLAVFPACEISPVPSLLAVVTVGDTQDWLPELIERAKGLKVGNGFDP
mgnify:FL=1